MATVYCDYKKSEEQSTEWLYRSIVRQVAESSGMISEVRTLFEGLWESNKHPPSSSELCQIVTSVAKRSRVFVILDALDEAGTKVQDDIIRKILELPFADVRLFCTSRPISILEEMLQCPSKIEIRATDFDISHIC